MKYTLAALALCTLVACSESEESVPVNLDLPTHIPAIPWPNDEVPSAQMVELGERLFYSPILSLDSSLSCSSCHLPNHGFADVMPVSEGIHGQLGFRNTPSIFNVAWKTNFFLEGGVDRIERATLGPMLTEEEMFLQAPDLLNRLHNEPSWEADFTKVFGRDFEYRDVIDALSAFQRATVSVDSKWDKVQSGEANYTADEELGELIFHSNTAGCVNCHKPPFFRDSSFHDVGMPISLDPDYGRGRFTFDSTDFYSFSTPSLRNVELTAPYMHDGSIPTLDSVIRFYEAGGVRDSEIKAFQLSDSERQALIAFLHALTGDKARQLSE